MRFNYLFRRSLAYFIDCIIAFSIAMLLIQIAVLVPLRGYIGIDDDFFREAWNTEIYVLLTISLPVWLYFSILDNSRAQSSFGKRMLKLRVTESDGISRLPFAKAFARTLLKLLPWELAHIGVVFPEPLHYMEAPEIRIMTIVGPVLLMIYFFSIIFTKSSQTLYDLLIGSKVVLAKQSKTA